MMRYLFLAFAVSLLLSSSVIAQNKSPIILAHQIYDSCMMGYFQASNLKPKKEDIRQFIVDAHEQCFYWTVIWYKPVTGNKLEIIDWDDASLSQLDRMMVKTMRDMDIEIRLFLNVK